MKPATRLAIVVSHPVQHFISFYRALSTEPDLDVHLIFHAPIGVESFYDPEMRSEIAWKMDLTGGYSHEFLEADGRIDVNFRSINSPKLTARLAAFAPDAVLIYGYSHINALRALAWCRRRRVPAIFISDSELLQSRSGSIRTVKRIIVPRVLARFDAFLSVGDNNERYYEHYGVPRERIFRSPFTIDEDTYRRVRADRAEIRAATRRELRLEEDTLVTLFVGKLTPRKRPGDLIEALARLPDDGRKVHALFAGNGELTEAMRERAARDDLPVTLLGFVNLDRLPALYAAADILVHPSSADPHPLVCSEGACIGLPMILSDRVGAEGPTDIARRGENALVYPSGDSTKLAEAIATLAGDPARLEAMSARSIAIFESLDLRRSVDGVKRALASV